MSDSEKFGNIHRPLVWNDTGHQRAQLGLDGQVDAKVRAVENQANVYAEIGAITQGYAELFSGVVPQERPTLLNARRPKSATWTPDIATTEGSVPIRYVFGVEYYPNKAGNVLSGVGMDMVSGYDRRFSKSDTEIIMPAPTVGLEFRDGAINGLRLSWLPGNTGLLDTLPLQPATKQLIDNVKESYNTLFDVDDHSDVIEAATSSMAVSFPSPTSPALRVHNSATIGHHWYSMSRAHGYSQKTISESLQFSYDPADDIFRLGLETAYRYRKLHGIVDRIGTNTTFEPSLPKDDYITVVQDIMRLIPAKPLNI